MLKYWSIIFFLVISVGRLNASFLDYFLPRRASEDLNPETGIDSLPKVPYELTEYDEQFLAEAAKVANLNLSELDLCHHRVILKLKKSCNELNADQLGKLAVMFLNCQSAHEGRQMFPCTETMTLKECTSDMSPEAWNAYHIVTNRVKAVCSTVRHEQFRGLTEMTVNKLMSTAHEQINLMKGLSDDQKQLREITSSVIDEISQNSEKLIVKQNDLLQLSSSQRASVEANLRELMREKSLIRSGQVEVAQLLADLRSRIDKSLQQLDSQALRSKLQYDSILDDLQASSDVLVNKIEKTTGFTLEHLQNMNTTIYNLATLVAELQEEFNGIAEKVGGTDFVLRRLNLILVHLGYILSGMLCLVFIDVDRLSRLIFITVAPSNFAAELLDYPSLDLLTLTGTILTLIITNYLIKFAKTETFKNIFTMKSETSKESSPEVLVQEENVSRFVYERNGSSNTRIYESVHNREGTPSVLSPNINRILSRLGDSTKFFDENLNDASSRSGTPFSSSLSVSRLQCTASTVKGGQCRNAAMKDGDYCRVHQRNRS